MLMGRSTTHSSFMLQQAQHKFTTVNFFLYQFTSFEALVSQELCFQSYQQIRGLTTAWPLHRKQLVIFMTNNTIISSAYIQAQVSCFPEGWTYQCCVTMVLLSLTFSLLLWHIKDLRLIVQTLMLLINQLLSSPLSTDCHLHSIILLQH